MTDMDVCEPVTDVTGVAIRSPSQRLSLKSAAGGCGLPRQRARLLRKHPCRTRLHQKYKCIRSVIEIAVFSDLMALLKEIANGKIPF